MPHKHTRRGKDPSTYDLPPTAHARPLPTYKAKPRSTTRISKSSSKASKASITPHSRSIKPTYLLNDTPRAFARLLRPPPPPRAGLDDGASHARKKRKANPPESASHSTATGPSTAGIQATAPQIQPGESLSNFSARVDASLPVSGLATKGKRIKGAVERQTKTERKMQRMVREWRAEEEKRRQRKKEAIEEQEDYESGNEDGHAEAANGKKKGKKGRVRKGASDNEDIWAHIAPKHSSAERDGGKEIGAGLVGLHDVVQAPPRFAKAPNEKFRASSEGRTKKGGLGLKRQAELGEARREVITAYRALMKENGRIEKSAALNG